MLFEVMFTRTTTEIFKTLPIQLPDASYAYNLCIDLTQKNHKSFKPVREVDKEVVRLTWRIMIRYAMQSSFPHLKRSISNIKSTFYFLQVHRAKKKSIEYISKLLFINIVESARSETKSYGFELLIILQPEAHEDMIQPKRNRTGYY